MPQTEQLWGPRRVLQGAAQLLPQLMDNSGSLAPRNAVNQMRSSWSPWQLFQGAAQQQYGTSQIAEFPKWEHAESLPFTSSLQTERLAGQGYTPSPMEAQPAAQWGLSAGNVHAPFPVDSHQSFLRPSVVQSGEGAPTLRLTAHDPLPTITPQNKSSVQGSVVQSGERSSLSKRLANTFVLNRGEAEQEFLSPTQRYAGTGNFDVRVNSVMVNHVQLEEKNWQIAQLTKSYESLLCKARAELERGLKHSEKMAAATRTILSVKDQIVASQEKTSRVLEEMAA
ncbi:hypothetical protein R1flu_022574 [Riccia fluitans]|uniref:Uncharacterized protein n=1 Tax=Riccia fluitans TaxID=41844 RepID=A0ABD1XPK4_9MARC